MQLILTDDQRVPLGYFFLPEAIQRPITRSLFDSLVEDDLPSDAKLAAFWADGDALAANAWRELLEAFVDWANRRSLLPMASSIATSEANVGFTLDWNVPYRDRGLAKICFTYMLSVINEARRYDDAFEPIRQYILNGDQSGFSPAQSPVHQWSGTAPSLAPGLQFTYLAATVTSGSKVLGLVQLHNMGLFCVKLTDAAPLGAIPDSLTIYKLDKNELGNYVMNTQTLSEEETRFFADCVRSSFFA